MLYEYLFQILFYKSSVPTSYDDGLKSSVIIPTSVLERDSEKYNHNNNIIAVSNASSSNSVALKIEEVSNETSNLMIEDRQNTGSAAARWISFSETFSWKVIEFDSLHLPI